MGNPFGRYSLPNLLFHHGAPIQPDTNNQNDHGFGRYSLPSMLGRLFHHEGNFNLSQEGPLSAGTYTPGQFGLNAPFTNPNTTSGLPHGYQTMQLQPFQPVDPNSLHVTPITDVRVAGEGNTGGQGQSGNAAGLTYNKLMGGGALAGWGTTRGPNYK